MTRAVAGTNGRGTGLVPHAFIGIGGRGPEDVIVDERGRVLTGVEHGRILRLDGLAEPDRARVETVADTGGRPLGLELLPDGDLLVCDARRGLLRVATGDGGVRMLADEVDGERLRFCSNVVALSDGTVYFTVSTRRYPLEHWIGDIVEHTGTGRLLRLAPGEERPEVVLEGLQFANGLASSADESFLVIAETGDRRLTRHWLTGATAGTSEPFVEDLPGTPDNMWRDADGLMWVALAGPRIGPLEALHRAGPAVRRAVSRVAVRAPYRPLGFAGVVAVDDQGRIVDSVVDRRSRFRMVTSACVADGRLILGSLWENGVAVCELPGEGH
ncbi:SMP-30/gluconolactonase/LRE family protein [Streptomyces sp. NPDC002643]